MKIVFVQRPLRKLRFERGALTEALRATAKNGKAVRLRRNPAFAYSRLARESLVVHTMRRGRFFLAWCENGTKKKGGR